MTDRELLELAAKAAGIEIKPHVNGRLFKELMFTYDGKNWNPLTDDGDALRLAWQAATRHAAQLALDAPVKTSRQESREACANWILGGME